jgi:hypothetical protein
MGSLHVCSIEVCHGGEIFEFLYIRSRLAIWNVDMLGISRRENGLECCAVAFFWIISNTHYDLDIIKGSVYQAQIY